MKRNILFVVIILLIFVCGCGDKYKAISKHAATTYKNSSFEIARGVNTLNINLDSGNLQIYCWDNKEIQMELKHAVVDFKTIEGLEKLLKEFDVTNEERKNAFMLSVEYRNKIAKNQNIYSDLKITIPKRIKNLNITQKSGSLAIEDKYEGNLTAQLDEVNSEIKSMKGQLKLKCKNGNVRLNSGKLQNRSYADVDAGNIFIKTECQQKSNYLFKTNAGNVDLNFPVSSDILVQSLGTILNNQFSGMEGTIKIETSTKMGKISVNRY